MEKNENGGRRSSPVRSILAFTKLSHDGEPTTPVALDMNQVACVTLSKMTGDVILVTKATPFKAAGTIVVAEGFNDVVKAWRRFGEILVFHAESRDPERSIALAVRADEIMSVDVGRGSRKVILSTYSAQYVLKDTFEEAMAIWQSDAT